MRYVPSTIRELISAERDEVQVEKRAECELSCLILNHAFKRTATWRFLGRICRTHNLGKGGREASWLGVCLPPFDTRLSEVFRSWIRTNFSSTAKTTEQEESGCDMIFSGCYNRTSGIGKCRRHVRFGFPKLDLFLMANWHLIVYLRSALGEWWNLIGSIRSLWYKRKRRSHV